MVRKVDGDLWWRLGGTAGTKFMTKPPFKGALPDVPKQTRRKVKGKQISWRDGEPGPYSG